MPRLNVIVLEKLAANQWEYVLWADVPTARQSFYAQAWGATRTSSWNGATATDNTNLQSGVMVEKRDTVQVPPGWNLAQVQAELQTRWQTYQNEITAYNPWVRYGTTWDGATWAIGGVA